MADHPVHHVTLDLTRGYEFVATFDDVPSKPTLTMDEPAPLGESHGPSAAALVAAATGNCLAASLLFCLEKSRASVGALKVHVAAHVERNDAGRMRISRIDVELEPELTGDDLARFERCSALFEDFCVMTQSLRQGVPVNVRLTPRKEKVPPS
jgi:uncharacterized OsmC-like protein